MALVAASTRSVVVSCVFGPIGAVEACVLVVGSAAALILPVAVVPEASMPVAAVAKEALIVAAPVSFSPEAINDYIIL